MKRVYFFRAAAGVSVLAILGLVGQLLIGVSDGSPVEVLDAAKGLALLLLPSLLPGLFPAPAPPPPSAKR